MADRGILPMTPEESVIEMRVATPSLTNAQRMEAIEKAARELNVNGRLELVEGFLQGVQVMLVIVRKALSDGERRTERTQQPGLSGADLKPGPAGRS